MPFKFDSSLRSLVEICQQIASHDDKPSIPRKFLNFYEDSFKHGPLDIHKDFVRELYHRFQHRILQKKEKFDWIESDSVTLIVGDGTPNPSKNIRIMISHFYRTAKKLQKDAELELEHLPDSAYQGRKELNYPDIVLLYVFRMFHCVCPDPDVSTIEFVLSVIESNLGMQRAGAPHPPSADPFGGIMSMANNFMASAGIPVPSGPGAPSPADMSNAFSGLVNNPNIVRGIQDMFGKIGKAKDFNEIVSLMRDEMNTGGLVTTAMAELQPALNNIVAGLQGANGKAKDADLIAELRNGPAGPLNPEDDEDDHEIGQVVPGANSTSSVQTVTVVNAPVVQHEDSDDEVPFK